MQSDSENKSPRFDPSSIDVEKKSMSIGSLIAMLQNDMIDLSPAFQREKNLWKSDRQSQLIESLMLKLPLPSMYFEYDKQRKKYIVIDGLQRLCTIKNFAVTQKLALRDLEFLSNEYDGATYESLSFNDRIELGLQEITVNILKGTTPDAAKYAIFKRINSSATTLTNQEIRNALYSGTGLQMLTELAAYPTFASLGFPPSRMDDREAVLRFMAFKIHGSEGYSGRMDSFLTNTLIELNGMLESTLDELKVTFRQGTDRSVALLGVEAMRLPGNKKRRPSKAIFDTLAVGLSELSDGEYRHLTQASDRFKEGFQLMLTHDKRFLEAVGNRSDRQFAARYRYSEFKALCSRTIDYVIKN